MNQSDTNLMLIFVIIIIVIIFIYIFLMQKTNNHAVNQEKHNINPFKQEKHNIEKFSSIVSQNIPTNAFNIANNLEYNMHNMESVSDNQINFLKLSDVDNVSQNNKIDLQGPSNVDGVNQNNKLDIFDDRGYKWTKPVNNPDIDVITNTLNDHQLRNDFNRIYMLDPIGDVAKYDISASPISVNCCPAQYSPPFKLTEDNKSNCDYAQKYVANQYSGMNYKNGYGCACITPQQAHYYGSRGGNST